MVDALTMLFMRTAAFGLRDGIQIILVLAICGFALWVLLTFVKMQPPFPQIIIFVVVIMLVWWLLSRFGLI